MKVIIKLLPSYSMLFISSIMLYMRSISKDSLYLEQSPPVNIPKVFRLQVPNKSFAAKRIALSNYGKNIYYQELDGYTELDEKPHTYRVSAGIIENLK